MLTFGMGGQSSNCKVVDIKWAVKCKKIVFNKKCKVTK